MCDTMAAVGTATSTGTVLFAKNSDREFDESQYLQLVPAARHGRDAVVRLTYKQIAQVPATNTVLLSKPHWIWGAEIGVNQHGLAIGNEAIHSKIEASLADGIIGMDYLRLALERSSTVDEGISLITTLLREHGQGGNCGFKREMAYHNSFILADSNGAKVLETVDRDWIVKAIDAYEAISNSVTIEKSFSDASAALRSRALAEGFKSAYEDATKSLSGDYRRGRALELLNERRGRINATDFFRILRDHKEGQPTGGKNGPRICAHTRENPLGQTTASWVSSLSSDRAVHWVTGTAAPCTGVFKPVMLETGLPAQGKLPGKESDSDSLWWRHEQLRRCLDDSDAQTVTEFHSERASLEARFIQQIEMCPAIVDAQSLKIATAAIERCWVDGLGFEDRWFHRFRNNIPTSST